MELELIKQLTDVGYPIALLMLVALGTKKMWTDGWKWWVETYWPGREIRWAEQAQSDAMRDAEYRRLAESFITAMRDYQDGFQSRNQAEHERMIREIEKMSDATVGQMELLVAEVRQWQDAILVGLKESVTQ